MPEPLTFNCVNCGTVLEQADSSIGSVVCPVCHFINEVRAASEPGEFTFDTLEHELGALIDHARSSGIGLDEIVRALRDELEFTAELASSGRNLSVQIIDLGPMESQGLQRPVRDRGAMLRGRAVGR